MLRMKTQASFPYLIEVVNKENENGTIVERVYRYANSDEEIFFEGNRFEPACFSITPPTRAENSISDGKLTFSTIDQFWIEKIRKTDVSPKVRFIAIIMYETSGVKVVEDIEDMEFRLISPTWNEFQIQFNMKYEDRMSLCVPIDVCNSRTTPCVV